jgi:hypothetical protein
MSSTILNCPHCPAENVGFSIVHEVPLGRYKSSNFAIFLCTGLCTVCRGGVLLKFLDAKSTGKSVVNSQIDPVAEGFKLIESYPSRPSSSIPEYLPNGLQRFYSQARDCLRRDAYDASGAMARKTLDVSTQQLTADLPGRLDTINLRVDALGAAGRITEDLRAWAHEIRLDGNDASHDEEPFTKEDATSLLDFLELYLTYVYTLPGRLRERRPVDPPGSAPPLALSAPAKRLSPPPP